MFLLTAGRPYLMDPKSTNATFINREKIKSRHFYELLHKDIVKFGHSTREYVFMCDRYIPD